MALLDELLQSLQSLPSSGKTEVRSIIDKLKAKAQDADGLTQDEINQVFSAKEKEIDGWYYTDAKNAAKAFLNKLKSGITPEFLDAVNTKEKANTTLNGFVELLDVKSEDDIKKVAKKTPSDILTVIITMILQMLGLDTGKAQTITSELSPAPASSTALNPNPKTTEEKAGVEAAKTLPAPKATNDYSSRLEQLGDSSALQQYDTAKKMLRHLTDIKNNNAESWWYGQAWNADVKLAYGKDIEAQITALKPLTDAGRPADPIEKLFPSGKEPSFEKDAIAKAEQKAFEDARKALAKGQKPEKPGYSEHTVSEKISNAQTNITGAKKERNQALEKIAELQARIALNQQVADDGIKGRTWGATLSGYASTHSAKAEAKVTDDKVLLEQAKAKLATQEEIIKENAKSLAKAYEQKGHLKAWENEKLIDAEKSFGEFVTKVKLAEELEKAIQKKKEEKTETTKWNQEDYEKALGSLDKTDVRLLEVKGRARLKELESLQKGMDGNVLEISKSLETLKSTLNSIGTNETKIIAGATLDTVAEAIVDLQGTKAGEEVAQIIKSRFKDGDSYFDANEIGKEIEKLKESLGKEKTKLENKQGDILGAEDEIKQIRKALGIKEPPAQPSQQQDASAPNARRQGAAITELKKLNKEFWTAYKKGDLEAAENSYNEAKQLIVDNGLQKYAEANQIPESFVEAITKADAMTASQLAARQQRHQKSERSRS